MTAHKVPDTTQPKQDTVGWRRFFSALEAGADLSTLTKHVAYLLLQPPPERHPELAHLEKECHERPPKTRLRILATLCAMRRVGDLSWRLSFVAGLLKDPDREVRRVAIDLAFEWGRTSQTDARQFYWLLRDNAASSACPYSEQRANELYMTVKRGGFRIAGGGLFRDILENAPGFIPSPVSSTEEQPVTPSSRRADE